MLLLEDRRFYTYLYLDPRKSGTFIYENYCFAFEPFYVGKGCNNRKNSHISEATMSKRNNRKLNKIRKIISLGYEPIIITMKQFLTECEALLLEENLGELIKLVDDGGTLTNGRYPKASSKGSGRFTETTKFTISLSKSDPISISNAIEKRKQTYKKHPEIKIIACKKTSITRKEKGIAKGENNNMYGKGDKLKGEKNGMYGKKHKQDSRLSMSRTKKAKGYLKGDTNPKWKKVNYESLKVLVGKDLYLNDIIIQYNIINSTSYGKCPIKRAILELDLWGKVKYKYKKSSKYSEDCKLRDKIKNECLIMIEKNNLQVDLISPYKGSKGWLKFKSYLEEQIKIS